jgi:hypothetical protein
MRTMAVDVDVEVAAACFANLVMDVEWERSWDESAASADDGLVAVLFVLVWVMKDGESMTNMSER